MSILNSDSKKSKDKTGPLFQDALDKMQIIVDAELLPYVDKIRATPKDRLSPFKDSYKRFRTHNEQSWEKFMTILYCMYKVRNEESLRKQLLRLFSYLGFVESLGNCCVDILVMVLVENGIDFHIESSYSTPRLKHAKLIVDLEKERVPLTTKINFLRDNGLNTIASIMDSKLRNDIAHMNFTIVNNEVRIRGKALSETVLPALDKLILMITAVDITLQKLSVDMGWEKEILPDKKELPRLDKNNKA